MAAMHADIEIRRPIADVFRYLTDLEHTMPATDPSIASVDKTGPGIFGPGTTFVVRQPMLGRMSEQTMTVLGAEPNRSIEMEAALGPVRPRFTLRFETSAAGTRVTFDGDSRPVGPFRLIPFVMDRVGQRNWRRRLGLIKKVLEERPTIVAE